MNSSALDITSLSAVKKLELSDIPKEIVSYGVHIAAAARTWNLDPSVNIGQCPVYFDLMS